MKGQLTNETVKSFSDLAKRFLEHRQSVKEISESCIGNYESQLRIHILPVVGGIKLEHLNLRDIERLAHKLKTTKHRSSSYKAVRNGEMCKDDEFLNGYYRKEILTLVCSIVRFGVDRDYLHRHPFRAFEMSDPGDRPFDYWRLEDEDKFIDLLHDGGTYVRPHTNRRGEKYDRVWGVWNHRNVYEVVLIALRTGMQKGEIAALTMDHVDFDSGIITVQAAWSEKEKRFKNQTKNGGYRRIEMNADVAEILGRYREEPNDKRIFAKIIASHTIKNFSKLTKQAGVREIHFHALRHTFLTNIANGIGIDRPVDILRVKELAGHSDIQTTMLYVHGAGIKDTSSLQWSRAQRKAQSRKVIPFKTKEARDSGL